MTMNLFPVDPRWYEQYWLTDHPPSASRKLLRRAIVAVGGIAGALTGPRAASR